MSPLYVRSARSALQQMKSGLYYGSQIGDTASAGAVILDRLYCMPLQVWEPTSFDRLTVKVTTGAATAVVRLGIYTSTSGAPSSLVLDAGTVDASAAATREATIAQTLTPGLYFLAAANQVAGSVQMSRINAGRDRLLGSSSSDAAAACVAFVQDSVTGAFPATLDSPPTAAASSPVILARAA